MVDGSITCPEIGLVVEPVSLTVSAGRVTGIDGGQDDSARILSDILGPLGSPRRVVAELGVGLNPLARLTGLMLTDEGALGGVHFGLGANATVGGVNDTDFHLDVVVRNASLSVDGREILNKGVLV